MRVGGTQVALSREPMASRRDGGPARVAEQNDPATRLVGGPQPASAVWRRPGATPKISYPYAVRRFRLPTEAMRASAGGGGRVLHGDLHGLLFGEACSLPGHVYTHGGIPQLWYAEWCRELNLSKRDRLFHFLVCRSNLHGKQGPTIKQNLGSMTCLEVLSRLLQVVVATTKGVDGTDWNSVRDCSWVRGVPDIVPSELHTLSSIGTRGGWPRGME